MTDGPSAEQERPPTPVTFLPFPGSPKNLEAPEPPEGYDPKTTEFILKTYELCNLACTYCYMYELRDKSYLQQPAAMSYEVAEQAAVQIGEHAEEHDLENVKIIFHGGEPLLSYLLDRDYYRIVTRNFRDTLGDRADFNMQTNGTLIAKHPEVLDMLHETGIKIGISLDGDPETHDALRIKRDGSGSFADVAAGIRTFAEWNTEGGSKSALGLLSVINLQADPHKVYDTLTQAEFGAASFDLLFPLAHHSLLPPGYASDYDQPGASTPYADWLIPLYDRWAQEDAGRISIRLFRSIQRLAVGLSAKAEYVGNSFARNLTIEANGNMALPDSYRSIGDGAIALLDAKGQPMNVETHSIDEAAQHHKVVRYRLGKQALSATCQKCHIVNICGAGLQANRWRDGDSLEEGGNFDNPSVYSQDLMKLILHIRTSVWGQIKEVLAKAEAPT
ncbi:MAG TPA: radical SAM protein [Verrucomicrobiae bacterium]|nr:radical SAM protein [Verrucomicrobiae bacterium]